MFKGFQYNSEDIVILFCALYKYAYLLTKFHKHYYYVCVVEYGLANAILTINILVMFSFSYLVFLVLVTVK